MDLQEKAKSYAEGKGLDMLKNAFEQAYREGYKEGFRVAENSKVNEVIDGVEYVDLGLPSRTKWATDYLKDGNGSNLYFSYFEAERMNLPTIEQYEEMLKCCRVADLRTFFINTTGSILRGNSFLGPNGKLLSLENRQIKKNELCSFDGYIFWIKNNEIHEDNMMNCAALDHVNRKQFAGYGLPVLLVK